MLVVLSTVAGLLASCAIQRESSEVRPTSSAPEVRNQAVGHWQNIYKGDPGLAGIRVQQFPDSTEDSWDGKHPAMILFVFWNGRVRQLGYTPEGRVYEDFWWQIGERDQYVWDQLDYTEGSDPHLRRHTDPRSRRTPSATPATAPPMS